MFESFWGSAASMELNAQATARAAHATDVALQWKQYAGTLEQRIGMITQMNHRLGKEAMELRSEIEELKRKLARVTLENQRLEVRLKIINRDLTTNRNK